MSHNKNSAIRGKASQVNLGLKNKALNKEAVEKFNNNFVISFEYLDRNQGQDFEDWNKEGLLVNMLNTLRDYCMKPLQENKGDKFKVYGAFPPKSKFKHPKHVPKDADWASLHINGKACLAGHVYENIFYVVFLDKKHEFWITKLKHT